MSYTKIVMTLLGCSALTACGGGGGGGGGGPVVGGPPSSQYYTTPVAQGTVDPLAGAAENASFVGDTFITDLDGDGAADDIVMAGRQSQPVSAADIHDSRLSVHSFENGQLVDKTAQWFSGTDNVIAGTEPDVKFADFFKTGKQDMFVSHGTDMADYGPATFFRNNGSNFTKVSVPTVGIWSHGSDVGDLNNDSYDDIIMLDYGPNSTIALNNTVDGFTTYVDPLGIHGHFKSGGSGVAIGNFMNNGGNNEIIVSDGACPLAYLNVAGCDNNNRTKMYSVDFTGGTLTYTFIKDLPAAANAAISDHHVRVVNHDYDEDGNADVIVFSRTSSSWNTELSEIQFLQNDGSGNFTDTTADTLIGYKTDTASTYKPSFFDINGDGKTDILVSGQEYAGNGNGYNSHQFLLKTADNKYIAAHQNILKNFMSDVDSIATGSVGGSTVNIFEGDDGNQYLVTWASTAGVDSDTKLTLFMSRLDDSATTISAGTAVTMLQNAWPYLSDAQATQALLDTSTSFAGGNVIDMNRAYQPIGNLAMGGLDLTGTITGFDIGNITGMATDSIGRGYGIDLAQANIVNTGTAMYNSIDTVRNNYTDGTVHFGADSDTQQWTVGNSYYNTENVTVSMHMTQLNSNPWIGFSGVWGDVKNASIIDNVVSYNTDNVTLKGSVMHVSTNFTPGLITDVSKQTGAWAEASYSDGGFRTDVGVHPVMLSGSVTANVPTSIDNTGTTHYTNYKFKLPTNINGYVRSQYTTPFKMGQLNIATAISQTGQQSANMRYSVKW